MTCGLLVGLGSLFVVICAWQAVQIGVGLRRLQTVSPRRHPLVSQAIRGHTLHLLLSALGVVFVLIAVRLPGDVNLYVALPPEPTAIVTPTVTATPDPSVATAKPSPPTVTPNVHALRLRREPFGDFPPFAAGYACDDDLDAARKKARTDAVAKMREQLAQEYKQRKLQFVLVIGTFDHTSLGSEALRRYDSNAALAQERAECVARMLREDLAGSSETANWAGFVHTMVAGPEHARHRRPTDEERRRDRSVRVLVGADVEEKAGG